MRFERQEFGPDLQDDGYVPVLPNRFVTDLSIQIETDPDYDPDSIYEHANDSGWTIWGQLEGDYYIVCTRFNAYHEDYGIIIADLDPPSGRPYILANTQDAFRDFIHNHPLEPLDVRDI